MTLLSTIFFISRIFVILVTVALIIMSMEFLRVLQDKLYFFDVDGEIPHHQALYNSKILKLPFVDNKTSLRPRELSKRLDQSSKIKKVDEHEALINKKIYKADEISSSDNEENEANEYNVADIKEDKENEEPERKDDEENSKNMNDIPEHKNTNDDKEYDAPRRKNNNNEENNISNNDINEYQNESGTTLANNENKRLGESLQNKRNHDTAVLQTVQNAVDSSNNSVQHQQKRSKEVSAFAG